MWHKHLGLSTSTLTSSYSFVAQLTGDPSLLAIILTLQHSNLDASIHAIVYCRLNKATGQGAECCDLSFDNA